jgi:hypothetical protein
VSVVVVGVAEHERVLPPDQRLVKPPADLAECEQELEGECAGRVSDVDRRTLAEREPARR